jgi:hypothetical protein
MWTYMIEIVNNNFIAILRFVFAQLKILLVDTRQGHKKLFTDWRYISSVNILFFSL